MKHLGLWAVLAMLITLSACEPFSYRKDYAGNYRFVTIRTVMNSTSPDSSTTIYDGYVQLFDKQGMLIRFKADDSIAPDMDKRGVLTIPGFVGEGGIFEGSFTDQDHVAFTSEFIDRISARVRYVVTGERR